MMMSASISTIHTNGIGSHGISISAPKIISMDACKMTKSPVRMIRSCFFIKRERALAAKIMRAIEMINHAERTRILFAMVATAKTLSKLNDKSARTITPIAHRKLVCVLIFFSFFPSFSCLKKSHAI